MRVTARRVVAFLTESYSTSAPIGKVA